MTEKIILGTAQFGLDYGINNSTGKPEDKELEDILINAFTNNISFLDTAEAYGNAQKRIGFFHEKHPDKQFNIITKFYENSSLKSLEQHVLNDLDELKVQQMYAYLFHNLKDLKLHIKEKEELLKLKKEELINKIGVSLYTNDEVEYVLSNFEFIDIIQIPFNLFDNINLRGSILTRMKSKGIEIHTRSAFLQGLFFKKALPERLLPLKPYVDLIQDISKTYAISIPELALRYCVNQPLIDRVLIGVDTKEQLTTNIKSLGHLDKEIKEGIDDIKIAQTELLNPVNW